MKESLVVLSVGLLGLLILGLFRHRPQQSSSPEEISDADLAYWADRVGPHLASVYRTRSRPELN